MDIGAQVQLVVRLTLGLIFLVSAVAKLRDPAAFVRGVLEYRVLPGSLARLYGWALPFVELGTALLLLSGFLFFLAVILVILMLASFAVAIIVVTMQGRQIGCNCFGTGHDSRVGWHTLARDLLLLSSAVWLLGAIDPGLVGANAWLRRDLNVALPALLLAALIALAYWLVAEGLEMLASLFRPSGGVV